MAGHSTYRPMPIRPGRAPPYRHAAACPHSWNTIDTAAKPASTSSSSGGPAHPERGQQPSGPHQPHIRRGQQPQDHHHHGREEQRPEQPRHDLDPGLRDQRPAQPQGQDRCIRPRGPGWAASSPSPPTSPSGVSLLFQQVINVPRADRPAELHAYPRRDLPDRPAPVHPRQHQPQQPGQLHYPARGVPRQEGHLRQARPLVLPDQLHPGSQHRH